MRSAAGPPVSLSAHSARGLEFGHAKPMHINLNVGTDSIPSHHPKESTYSTLGSTSATSFAAYNSPEIAPASYPYASFRRPSSPTPSLLKSRVSDTGSIFREEVWPPPEAPTFVDPIEANSSQVDLSGIVDEVMGPGALGVRSSSYSHADKKSRASRSGSMSKIHERGWTADSTMTSSSAGGWSVVNDYSARRTTADSHYSDPFKNPSSDHSRSPSSSSSSPTSPSPIPSPTFSSSVSPVLTHIPTNPQSTFTTEPTPRNSLKTLPPGALKPYVPNDPVFSPSPPFVPSPQPHIPSPPSASHHSSNSYSHISDTPMNLNISTPSRTRVQPKVSSPLARALSGDAKVWLGKRQVDHERSYSAGNAGDTSTRKVANEEVNEKAGKGG
ncbi:hypothetical protein CPB83DRAFT_494902 [Crepidotus variabilis]|uniref:Uncharacterized protein n=1 Tax=Crepidotus variabilis TaxID=179855 RepID=A0A9P6ECB1_9AGAR|nr:hypothetical protein CPB83DRAFT_494902 [Crepidotus variabilis]